MDSYRWLFVALAGFVLFGCHGGVETDVLEREIRLQEDRIYALQDKIDEYRTMLDSYQRDNQSLRSRLDGDQTDELGIGTEDFMPVESPTVEPGEPASPWDGEIPGGSGALPSIDVDTDRGAETSIRRPEWQPFR